MTIVSDDARPADGAGTDTDASANCLTVYYDGSCPLCRREIGFYQKRANAGEVHWEDVSQWSADFTEPDLGRETAMGRFHVRDADGHLVSGGVAFAALWRSVPGFRLLGRMGQWQPASFVLDRLYDLFLHIRPWVQRRFHNQ